MPATGAMSCFAPTLGVTARSEVWTPELHEKYPGRDWILTRILWLSGCETSTKVGSLWDSKPGDKEPMHSHRQNVVYIVQGGKERFTLSDGQASVPVRHRGTPPDLFAENRGAALSAARPRSGQTELPGRASMASRR